MASPSTPLPDANLTLTLALFKKLGLDDKTKNLFFSPFGIFSALTQVLSGAKGNTYDQIYKVLGLCKALEPQPEQPEQPEQPGQPGQPEQPEQSGQPGQPEQPEQPGQPKQPMKMEQEPTEMRTQLQCAYQSQMQTRMKLQTQSTTRIPSYLLQCLKPKTGDDIHVQVSELMSKLNKKDTAYSLSVANRLFGEETSEFLKDFLDDIKKYYGAGPEKVDFKTKAEEARVTINSWVEEKTQGKIKDLLVEGMVDDSSRLVVVNAIYFKGLWENKFKEEFTEDGQFKMNKDNTKPVKLMRQRRKFLYRVIPEIDIKVLEMPYKNKDLSMIILLPNDETTGLEKLETELTPEKFVDWTQPKDMNEGRVDVKLPRFNMEEIYDLSSVLREMGMTDAFDISLCDFSGMSSPNDLVLSRAIHKSNVEVTEEGTEAASAIGDTTSECSSEIKIYADHPFLFFIRHNPSNTILFFGRFCSPSASPPLP